MLTGLQSEPLFVQHIVRAIDGQAEFTRRLLYAGGYCSANLDEVMNPIDDLQYLLDEPDWQHWRRGASGLEIKWSTGWEPFDYPYEVKAVAQGTALSGLFMSDLLMLHDGHAYQRQEICDFQSNGSFASSLVERIVGPSNDSQLLEKSCRRGCYELDGYKIHFTYDDGAAQTEPFFYDAQSPTRLWIRNRFFEQRCR